MTLTIGRIGLFCWIALACAIPTARGTAVSLEPLGSAFRQDELFPTYAHFWHEGWNTVDESAAQWAAKVSSSIVAGGSVHVFVRNSGAKPLEIQDVSLDGMPLSKALAFSDQRKNRKPASIYFADLTTAERDTLIASGEPVWWKADPRQVPPQGTAEIIIRLRRVPDATSVRIGVRHTGGAVSKNVAIRADAPRIVGIRFSPALDRAVLYVRNPEGRNAPPSRILLDGRVVTRDASIGHDPAFATTLVVVRMQPALAAGSYHCFQVDYDGGSATAGRRAWAPEFAYGIWGGLPGKASELEVGRRYVEDITSHNINVQMPQIGSPAVQSFFKSDAGQALCRERGLRKVISDPGKYGTKDPFALFIHDEPDCGDYRMEGPPFDKKVGCLAQWAVQHGEDLRNAAPSVPLLLNVDMTFKPYNWYTYGHVPDILAADPYYQERLCSAYWSHPERLWIYTQATYIYAVGSVCASACAPKPLHLILNAVRHTDREKNRAFRFATPEEKRIEAFYAVAAGAQSLSYWWYTPSGTYFGVGAADHDPQAAALWREIGLIGAELRTAESVILAGCPAELPLKLGGGVWGRTLLSNLDTAALILVNHCYANDRTGTVYQPVEQAKASIELPSWLTPKDVFEINHGGTHNVGWTLDGNRVTLAETKLELTRMVVITADAALRSRIQERYLAEFSKKVERLLKL
ncbi:MAG: hypothetical protein JXA69_05385 [Phycisphaerae bacterium]|nr:hypothetical protein [Phycisphaerae bacterium]